MRHLTRFSNAEVTCNLEQADLEYKREMERHLRLLEVFLEYYFLQGKKKQQQCIRVECLLMPLSGRKTSVLISKLTKGQHVPTYGFLK